MIRKTEKVPPWIHILERAELLHFKLKETKLATRFGVTKLDY